jgi:hypothetical protein
VNLIGVHKGATRDLGGLSAHAGRIPAPQILQSETA